MVVARFYMVMGQLVVELSAIPLAGEVVSSNPSGVFLFRAYLPEEMVSGHYGLSDALYETLKGYEQCGHHDTVGDWL